MDIGNGSLLDILTPHPALDWVVKEPIDRIRSRPDDHIVPRHGIFEEVLDWSMRYDLSGLTPAVRSSQLRIKFESLNNPWDACPNPLLVDPESVMNTSIKTNLSTYKLLYVKGLVLSINLGDQTILHLGPERETRDEDVILWLNNIDNSLEEALFVLEELYVGIRYHDRPRVIP